MMVIAFTVLIFTIAYIIGSIPFGLVLAKIFGYGDIRKIGSGNIGATNVLRTGNKKLAALTLILDASKGIIAIAFIAIILIIIRGETSCITPIPENLTDPITTICNTYWEEILSKLTYTDNAYSHAFYLFAPLHIGLFAIIGHCYPIWLKFKGGKGVATTLGVLLAAVPFSGMLACLTWLISAKAGKISSLAAISAMICAPAYTYALYGLYPALINVLISLLVIWRHRENIARIKKGTEPKIGDKKKEEATNNAP